MPRRSTPPDAGHGCADPSRCSRPFCARSVNVALVVPEQTRTVTRDLPGWPVSAAALFDSLNARITRQHLVNIVGNDPLGAYAHFPILVRIRQSGRVPPRLSFDPGEALRLERWNAGPLADPLTQAWCCTILAICPTDEYDGGDLTEIAAQVVDGCLLLGGDAPELAERLFAWRAISDDPAELAWHRPDKGDPPHPVALLALLLLRAATDPSDARLSDLARMIAGDAALPAALTDSVSAPRWRDLLSRVLTPLSSTRSDLAGLLDTLPR